MRFALLALVAISLALSTAGCSKNQCTAAKCQTLESVCRKDLAADGFEACVRKGLKPPSPYDNAGCVQACEQTGAGDKIDCVVSLGASCAQSTGHCLDGPTQQADCVKGCASNRTTCTAACSSTSWPDCLSCATTCGATENSCVNACPAQ